MHQWIFHCWSLIQHPAEEPKEKEWCPERPCSRHVFTNYVQTVAIHFFVCYQEISNGFAQRKISSRVSFGSDLVDELMCSFGKAWIANLLKLAFINILMVKNASWKILINLEYYLWMYIVKLFICCNIFRVNIWLNSWCPKILFFLHHCVQKMVSSIIY